MPAYSPRAAAQVFSACAEVVPEDKQGIPLLEVQAGHELRVTEVAVEFIRAGFTWVPALATGKGSSKISDGVAWLGDYRIEVEIELSGKKTITVERHYRPLSKSTKNLTIWSLLHLWK